MFDCVSVVILAAGVAPVVDLPWSTWSEKKTNWLKLGLDVDKGGRLWKGINLNNGGFIPCLRASGKDKKISRIVCDSSWGGIDCD